MTMTTFHHFSFHCRLFFCYTEFLEMHNTSCSHPPSLLTVLHSHPQVVITTKWPTILFGSSLEGSKRLIFPVCQLKVTHFALCPFSPLSSVLPCCLLILLHQLTFETKRAFECSFCIILCVTGENVA